MSNLEYVKCKSHLISWLEIHRNYVLLQFKTTMVVHVIEICYRKDAWLYFLETHTHFQLYMLHYSVYYNIMYKYYIPNTINFSWLISINDHVFEMHGL